jgi:dipeptidase E
MPTAPRLLLISNSTDPDGNYLTYPRQQIADFLGPVRRVTFVPYAGVTIGWDAYVERVAEALAPIGCAIESVHTATSPRQAIDQAEAIMVGGGNTFHLLRELYATGLLDAIRERVAAGVPYLGWSAGALIACPSMRTTNDMPIVEPPSLDTLGLVPFQINAHFSDAHPPGFRGETRRQRLAEFLVANPGMAVLGLPEGMMLRLEGQDLRLHGTPTSADHAPVFGIDGMDRAPFDQPLDRLMVR